MVGRLLRIPTAHMAMVREPGGSDTMVRELPRSMAKVEHSFVVVQRWQRCDAANCSLKTYMIEMTIIIKWFSHIRYQRLITNTAIFLH